MASLPAPPGAVTAMAGPNVQTQSYVDTRDVNL